MVTSNRTSSDHFAQIQITFLTSFITAFTRPLAIIPSRSTIHYRQLNSKWEGITASNLRCFLSFNPRPLIETFLVNIVPTHRLTKYRVFQRRFRKIFKANRTLSAHNNYEMIPIPLKGFPSRVLSDISGSSVSRFEIFKMFLHAV